MIDVLIRKDNLDQDKDMHREDDMKTQGEHHTTEEGIGVMQLSAKEHQRLLANSRS